MTPKEKANELVDKCRFALYDNLPSLQSEIFKQSMTEASKQCTLTAVDEIMNIAYWEYMDSGGGQEKSYWQQVRQEIEKI